LFVVREIQACFGVFLLGDALAFVDAGTQVERSKELLRAD
jgi:hypothetical protein